MGLGIKMHSKISEDAPQPVVNPYLKDGLIMWLDGIKGAEEGASASWTDLSGNGNNGVITGTASWGNNHLVCTRAGQSGIETALEVFALSNYTIEMRFAPDAFYDYNPVWSQTDENTNIESWIYSTGVLAARGGSYGRTDIASLLIGRSYTFSYMTQKMYLDGSLIGSDAGTPAVSSVPVQFNKREDYGSKKIYSVRVYNRQLTDEEALANYTADADRFPNYEVSVKSHIFAAGETAAFTAQVSGNAGTEPSYQWYVSSDSGTSWTLIDGAESSSYSVTEADGMEGYMYKCTASKGNFSASGTGTLLADAIETYLDNTSLMDTTSRNGTKNDDSTESFAGVSWFNYSSAAASAIYISGNLWTGLGASSEQIKICRRDGADYFVYREEGTVKGHKFLKMRVEGYSYYSSTDDQYKVVYELFLFDDNRIFINIVHIPTNSSFMGTSEIVCGSNVYPLSEVVCGAAVPIYYTLTPPGSSGTSWTVENKLITF